MFPTAGPTVRAGPWPRFLLAEDLDELVATDDAPVTGTRLLGPFDLYLQLHDRALLVPVDAHRKDLWRSLGRPGAILHEGEIVGTWRARAKKTSLAVAATAWTTLRAPARDVVEVRAERLAHHRGVACTEIDGD